MVDLILEIVEGPDAGRQVPLEGPLEIGRDKAASLVVDDQLVSRRHARVEPAADTVVVKDLDSLNGTFVNGHQIYAPARLDPGDHILMGVTVFEVRTATQVKERPSAVRPIPPALAAPPHARDFALPQGRPEPKSSLDPLLDVRVKKRANAAPLAVFLLAVIVVVIFLATR